MKGLRVDEVSGVDHPAHKDEGWMVIKSAAGGGTDPLNDLTDEQIEQLIKAAEAEEEGEPVKDLIESLTKARDTMSDAAKAQADALLATLGGGGGAGDDPVAKAVAEALTKVQGERDAAVTKAAELETQLARAAGGASGETEEEALAKALDSMPEPVRKAWIEGQARIAKAEADAATAAETAKVEKDARISTEYLTKAKGPEYAGLPVKAETLGTVLREVDEHLSKEAGAEVHRLLKAAAHAVATGGADFTEFGGAGEDVSSANGAKAALAKAAEELRQKDPTMDMPTAITKAYDLHPDLARAAMPQGGEG